MPKTSQNPALQQSPSKGNRTMQFFAERATHRDEIVAGDDNRNVFNADAVHRIRMIADVQNHRPASKTHPQLPRKQDKLIDVSEPFADEVVSAKKISEHWSGGCDFRGNSG